MNRTTLLVVLIALAGATAGFVAGGRFAPERAMPPPPPGVAVADIGEPYPRLTLATLDGPPRALASWDGKPRLVNFWATWCGPCVEEMPLLDRMHRELDGRLHVIGVALDDPAAVRRFVADTGVSYPILLDTPGPADASVRFGDTRGVLPYSVLIDAEGRIVARKLGSFHEAGLREWLSPVLE
jgi:thiol-disulfide isomerase/thioredoxin